MRRLMLLALVGSLGFAAGCKSGDDDDAESGSNTPKVDCNGDVPAYADVAIFDKCSMCHSSKLTAEERMEAPKDINFDTEAGADAKAAKAVTEVSAGDMPPRDSGIKVTDAEKQALYTWALCMSK
jgi:uncharacterized membrane protein